MALYKRGNTWWIYIVHGGRRIRKTSGTENKIAAQQLHDKLKAELWQVDKLKEKPTKTWKEAVVRWFSEMQHKRSLRDDKWHVKWLDNYFGSLYLVDITKNKIEETVKLREAEGVTPASINRLIAFIRAVMRKSANEWEWIEHAPAVRTRHEDNKRIRWITREEVIKLLNVLPSHLSSMAEFALATGLRQANVKELKWQDVDLEKRHAIIHHDQAKGKKNLAVPLNEDALRVLKCQLGKHKEYVFTYGGKQITQVSTRAWRKALSKAGIKNFRWHDLRHTWASWHIQQGTSLQELQVLGGWASFEMVLRYAHLSSDHLKNAAERISIRS